MTLRLRLGLWYGTLTALIVALVCTYSYAIHARTHYDELDRVLRSVADHVADELSDGVESHRNVLDASLLLGTGIRLVDAAGRFREQSRAAAAAPTVDLRRVLASPSAAPYAPVASIAPRLHQENGASGRLAVVTDAGGKRFRVYAAPIAGGAEYLIATVPLAHIDDAVAGFGRLMLLMALGAGLVALIAGWLLARRALRPIAILTDVARGIADSREFSRRVAEGSARDELGRLAHTFNRMLASLADAFDAQTRFVSAASHELRAPLTIVKANLELLESGRLSDDDRATAIVESHAEAGRMARLVADLLVLARADAGVPIRRELVELDRVLIDVVGDARHLVRGQRVQVTGVEPATVRGDADRLRQLLLNLTENAIKYTPQGGRVTTAIRVVDGQAVVTVADTGIGISADDRRHVFERFYRADPARSRDPGGSGLGLSIAAWVVAEHGGTIDLASMPGAGTTVTVTLPLAGAGQSIDRASA